MCNHKLLLVNQSGTTETCRDCGKVVRQHEEEKINLKYHYDGHSTVGEWWGGSNTGHFSSHEMQSVERAIIGIRDELYER